MRCIEINIGLCVTDVGWWLTLTWDVLKYEQEIEVPDMTMININMRCIEICNRACKYAFDSD